MCGFALAAAVLSACGGEETCSPPVWVYPLRVEVTDATTGETLCGVRVRVRSGDREEVLTGECSYVGGWGPETYDVLADLPGYAPGTRANVRVRALGDECPSWETVRVSIALDPL
jgi:hypothetical protein